MPRIFHRSSYLVLLLLPACVEKNSLGSLDSSGDATTTVGVGSIGETTAPPEDPTTTSSTGTGDPSDITTSALTETSAAESSTTEKTFIVFPDGGAVSECDCADDMLCVQSHGIDSWFFVCAIPPPGCDPADPCSQACATACAVPPPLPGMCDGREPPQFLDCDDAAGFECSTWAENCPAGSKCVPHPFDPDIRCDPIVERPAEPGEPCTGPLGATMTDSCVAGSGCWGFDPVTQDPVCAVHCTGTLADPVCPPATDCRVDPMGFVAVCLPTCDPLLQDCGAGQSCAPGLEAFVCVEDVSASGGEALDSCVDDDFCDPGLLCLEDDVVPGCDSKSCCTPYCDLEAPTCTVPGTTCKPMFDQGQAPPGAEDVGVCVKP